MLCTLFFSPEYAQLWVFRSTCVSLTKCIIWGYSYPYWGLEMKNSVQSKSAQVFFFSITYDIFTNRCNCAVERCQFMWLYRDPRWIGGIQQWAPPPPPPTFWLKCLTRTHLLSPKSLHAWHLLCNKGLHARCLYSVTRGCVPGVFTL